jgi:hypothetical protein
MKAKETDIVHSLDNQLTYVKGVAQISKVNADAVKNLFPVD